MTKAINCMQNPIKLIKRWWGQRQERKEAIRISEQWHRGYRIGLAYLTRFGAQEPSRDSKHVDILMTHASKMDYDEVRGIMDAIECWIKLRK